MINATLSAAQDSDSPDFKDDFTRVRGFGDGEFLFRCGFDFLETSQLTLFLLVYDHTVDCDMLGGSLLLLLFSLVEDHLTEEGLVCW